eukprot:1158831-Pelagomonas_calceolata.AAC.9
MMRSNAWGKTTVVLVVLVASLASAARPLDAEWQHLGDESGPGSTSRQLLGKKDRSYKDGQSVPLWASKVRERAREDERGFPPRGKRKCVGLLLTCWAPCCTIMTGPDACGNQVKSMKRAWRELACKLISRMHMQVFAPTTFGQSPQ